MTTPVHYAVKDRNGTIHPEGGKKAARSNQKAYGGMVVRAKGEGEYTPWKPRKVFLWVFLAIQVCFIAWLISAAASGTGTSPADIAATCGGNRWYPLWKSYNDCAAHSGVIAAHDVGKGIAVGAIITVWVVIDFIVGLTYGIYRLVKR